MLQLKKLSKEAEPDQAVVVKELPAKPRGRPPLLGDKLDNLLKERIISMCARGAPVATNVIIGIGRGILLKNDKRSLEEFGGYMKLGKEWARSVLRRMGFSKRRGNSKSKVKPDDLSVLRLNYLMDIKGVVEMAEIPDDMIINWDHTAMKIVVVGLWKSVAPSVLRSKASRISDR